MSNEKMVRVKILPLHNIGGIGNAGDVVWMSAADAEMYARDGFVEVVEETTPTTPTTLPSASPQIGERNLEGEEPRKIMKPLAKPLKKKRK